MWDSLQTFQYNYVMKNKSLFHRGLITLHEPLVFGENGNHFSLSKHHPSVFKGYQPSTIGDLDPLRDSNRLKFNLQICLSYGQNCTHMKWKLHL